jgi:hypothetical protein
MDKRNVIKTIIKLIDVYKDAESKSDLGKKLSYGIPINGTFYNVMQKMYLQQHVIDDVMHIIRINSKLAKETSKGNLIIYRDGEEYFSISCNKEVFSESVLFLEKLLRKIKRKSVSFEYEKVLGNKDVQEYAKSLIDEDIEVYVLTSKVCVDDMDDVYELTDSLGIDRNNIFISDGIAKEYRINRFYSLGFNFFHAFHLDGELSNGSNVLYKKGWMKKCDEYLDDVHNQYKFNWETSEEYNEQLLL